MCVSYRCLIYIEVLVAVAVLVVVVGTFGTLVHAITHTQQMEKTLHIYEIHLQNERSFETLD